MDLFERGAHRAALRGSGQTTARTLVELGITEINLDGDSTDITLPDGSKITAQITFSRADGSSGIVANLALVSEERGHRAVRSAGADCGVPDKAVDRVLIGEDSKAIVTYGSGEVIVMKPLVCSFLPQSPCAWGVLRQNDSTAGFAGLHVAALPVLLVGGMITGGAIGYGDSPDAKTVQRQFPSSSLSTAPYATSSESVG